MMIMEFLDQHIISTNKQRHELLSVIFADELQQRFSREAVFV
jgi:hypothetical protein